MITSLSSELMETNKKRFILELQSVERKGTDEFLEWLETTDFFTAPASTKGHLPVKGGLCQHSLNVLLNARLLNKVFNIDLDQKTITMPSLLHDLCKVNFYKSKIVWDKEWKEKTNQWRTTEEWFIEDSFPLGHGEKSMVLALRYLELLDEEIAAVRWHIGAFEQGIHFNYPTGNPFKSAVKKYPLVKLVMIADMMAEFKENLEKATISES